MPMVDELRCSLGMILIDWALSVLPKREAVELAGAIHPLSSVWAERVAKEVQSADSRGN